MLKDSYFPWKAILPLSAHMFLLILFSNEICRSFTIDMNKIRTMLETKDNS